jgi:hypothetical protein
MIEVIRNSGPTAREKLVNVIHNQALLGTTQRDEVLLLIMTSLGSKYPRKLIANKVNKIYDRMHEAIEDIITLGQRTRSSEATCRRMKRPPFSWPVTTARSWNGTGGQRSSTDKSLSARFARSR